MFQLCHLGHVKCIEQAFIFAGIRGTEILEEEEYAGDALVAVFGDIELFVVLSEHILERGEEGFAFCVIE